tara:strand:+ start:2430 stop:3479 length:1050 start_codon:yes stop_codon:yes gene_type:complete
LALANGLAKAGMEVTLLCRYDKESAKDYNFHHNLKFVSVINPGIPFERLLFTKHSYQKVLDILKFEKFDIVHDRGYIFAGSGVQAASESGVKSILQVDDNWMRSELSATRLARLWPYHEKAIRSCRKQIELANGGFTVSSILRDQISEWNSKAKSFKVIQNGYEDDLFNLNVQPLGIKEKLGLDGKMVVFVGALGPWHGVEELGEIANLNPDVSVVVAGGGYGKNVPDKRNLHHIGRLSRSEVPGLLVEADIGLAPYPNLDYGFSPLKIYEYMGCKLPVVATRLPSVEEATQGHALLVQPGQMANAISKVINNEKLLSDLSESAFTYASKERTWAKTIEKTIELYEEIL